MPRRNTSARSNTAPVADCAQCLRTAQCWPLNSAARLGVQVQRCPPIAAGQSLWQQGDAFRGLFVVTGGSFKLRERCVDGGESITAFRFSGDLLGLDAIADGVHVDEAIALERATVCRLQWNPVAESDAFSVLDRELLARQAFDARAERTQRLRARGSAIEAVAGMLAAVWRARRGGTETSESAESFERLPMSGTDLASCLGLAEETVSRALRSLESDGRLERRGRQFRWLGSVAASQNQP
jgi:CRP/FNR family transcriptional regulator, anaerobic regulatory protein